MDTMTLKDEIKSKYGEAAQRAASVGSISCYAPSCCGGDLSDPGFSSNQC